MEAMTVAVSLAALAVSLVALVTALRGARRR